MKSIKDIFYSFDSFINKKRSLCDLKIANTLEMIGETTDEKILKYLKRRLKREKHQCKELWR